jgi:C4-dicarboxylate-specific signal transduction histidine kinase
MVHLSPRPMVLPAPLLPVATTATAVAVFVADASTPPECVVSGLYVVVVLMAGRFCSALRLWFIAGGCAVMTLLAQFLAHQIVLGHEEATNIGAFNSAVIVLAIALSTSLVLRGRSAEAALRQAQTDLAHVSRVTTMGELTASIAHEVNQPIAAMVTNASACLRWLAHETPDLEKARTAATRIVRDGTRAAEIISRIRLIFSKGTPQRQAVDINRLVRETIELLGNQATRHAVSIQTDLTPDMPQIMADPVQLQQVVVNLIVNGIDAMKDVAGARQLGVTSRRAEDDQVVVSVSDTGIGLPQQQADQVFNAFFTTKPHGTGMGLSISRSIIEAHRGRLWAAPNEPGGATFAFALPIRAETARDGAPAES